MVNAVSVILKKGKRTNGEHPIYLRIVENRKAKLISIGFTVKLSEWNTKKEEHKKSHPLYEVLVAKINEARLAASKAVVKTNAVPTRKILEEAVQKEAAPIGVLAYAKQTVTRLQAEQRWGYANAF